VNLWHIREDRFDPKQLHTGETIYTIGNGYLGTRGAFEEGYPQASPATLLWGVFDSIAVGREELANVPDWLPIKLFVNGERFRLDEGRILDYERTLDMQAGVLSRVVRWESPHGIRIKVAFERFASLANPHVGAIRLSVTAEEQAEAAEQNAPAKLEIVMRASINLAVGNYDLMHFEAVDQGHDDDILWYHTQTRHSNVQLAQTMTFTARNWDAQTEVVDSDSSPGIRLSGTVSPGGMITAEKIVVMCTSRDVANPVQAALDHHKQVMSVSDNPYQTLLQQHKEAWERYWEISDVIIEGDDQAQQATRYNIYQLRISTSATDDRYSIAAKGLTGFGYRGHVFHDTEIFMLPYFTYVHPGIARNLLLYRYHLLPAARAKAQRNGFEGAQFPWESTLDGEETTPEAIIHPESKELIPVLNGKLELHISASIAYATWNYWFVSGDDAFMQDYGAEMLLSTAAFWSSRAEYNADRHDFEINNVIGPDEWHEHVNNNAFTNYMARWNIQEALNILDWLRSRDPAKAEALTEKLDLTNKRLDHWRDVIARMRIPKDKRTRVFKQFDGFFKLKHLDQATYKGRTISYQALLGMDEVQQYQIIKQADVLMLMTLMNQKFDLDTIRANWDYYFPITDHAYGSSLTPAFHVILACKLGLVDIAYKQFMIGALVDLEELRGNSAEGIHDACAGAVWQAVIFGFAGLRVTEDGCTTHVTWPDGWTRLAFSFLHKGKVQRIDLRKS
jgi:trehalose/maltose hydrolase-like predicted phosphorylase